ncbi:MAG: DNA-directed RNA polymerase subunit P [Halobacteriota archaeon]
MPYKCARCKRETDIESARGIKCPFCGHRIFLKERGGGVKRVEVR